MHVCGPAEKVDHAPSNGLSAFPLVADVFGEQEKRLFGAGRHEQLLRREAIAYNRVTFSYAAPRFVNGSRHAAAPWSALGGRQTLRPPFKILPKRWIVERTFGWLSNYRRFAKDYEYHPAKSEALIFIAASHLMLRRLA